MIYHNDAANIEQLHYVAKNFPNINEDASNEGLLLIKKSFYGTKHLEYFEECLSIEPSQEVMLAFKERIKEEITELQYSIEELNAGLDDLDRETCSKTISKLREFMLRQALLCLSIDNFQLAATNLTYFTSNYSSVSYYFRDLELRSSIAYISKNYIFVNQISNKIFKTVHDLDRMQYPEIISLVRTAGTIIMCEFKLKNYSKVLEYFQLLIDLCHKYSKVQDLLKKSIETFQHVKKTYFNVFNSNDIKLSILFSIMVISADSDINIWTKHGYFQSLFTDFPVVYEFVRAFLSKKFALQSSCIAQISENIGICTQNFQKNDDFLEVTRVLLLRNIIFYFSIVEKVSLSQLLATFGMEKKAFLPIVIQLIRVMELNIVYDSSNDTFNRKSEVALKPLKNLPIILKNLEAGNEAAILQNQILDLLIN